MNLTMIGTGYVGLVSGACFAELGFNVTCMDIDGTKIKNLQENGEIPIHEPGLEDLVKKNIAAGRLHFTTDLSICVPISDAVFIGVGTPQDEDGSADMQYVLAAATAVSKHLNGYTVIVNKSTVPVGTGKRVEDEVHKANPAAEFDIVSNPEFLREGCAVEDFLKPDRIVIGVPSKRSLGVIEKLYAPLTDKGVPLVVTNRESSEIIKYAANAFLAVKITFINEIARLCDTVGADVMDVSNGLGLDTRIGNRFLQPGPGYGGSCFPKDTNAIAKTARDHNCPLPIIETTINSNNQIKEGMADRIIMAAGGSVKGKKIAFLGLAFKAGTDDMRDASALTIIPRLLEQGAEIHAYDPAAMPRAKELMPKINTHENIWDALANADIAVILTEWPEFKSLDLNKLVKVLAQPTLVDLRNLLSAKEAKNAGLNYSCVGRSIL